MTAANAFALASSVVLAGALLCGGARAEPPVRIPLVVGLTTIRAVAETQGDYESIRTVTSVGSKGYSFGNRAEVPDSPGGPPRAVKTARSVPMADHLHARVMRNRFNVGDPEVFAGTTPGVSADIVSELRSAGMAAMTFIDARQMFGLPTEISLKGTVRRVGAGTEDFAVIVNGRRSVVRVLHARGRIGESGSAQDLEFHVLDDLDNPLMLSASGPGFTSRITRIEFPLPLASALSIESKLAANEPVEVYGIYFSFASDKLRPESDRVLQEVADVMKKHPDWKILIDGHTDNVGGSTANLDLSRRRAAAVKTALVQQHAIVGGRLDTGGYGAGRPRDTNNTIEGRALNRRVELRRL